MPTEKIFHTTRLFTDLEVSDIHNIKSRQGSEEPDVSLGDGGPGQVAPFRQDLLHSVQPSKHFPHGCVVGSLGSGKSSSVHTIVDIPVDIVGGKIAYLKQTWQ